MATVIPAAQQVGGLVTVALVLIIGITLLVGGTAGGWFDGADSDKVSVLEIMCNYVQGGTTVGKVRVLVARCAST